MDITAYKNSDGKSLIEIPITSAPVAWLNEHVAQHLTKEQMLVWCKNFYETRKLTDQEQESLNKKAIEYKKNVPQDFYIGLTIACEMIYWLIKKDIGNQVN
jgi:Zn-dependent M32 family carboxypeptidase